MLLIISNSDWLYPKPIGTVNCCKLAIPVVNVAIPVKELYVTF